MIYKVLHKEEEIEAEERRLLEKFPDSKYRIILRNGYDSFILIAGKDNAFFEER